MSKCVGWDPKLDPGAGRSIESNRRMCKSSMGYSPCGLVNYEKEIIPTRDVDDREVAVGVWGFFVPFW